MGNQHLRCIPKIHFYESKMRATEKKPSSNFKTKKAARNAGLRTEQEWLRMEKRTDKSWRRPLIPKRDAEPIGVKNMNYFSEADCEEVVSKREAARRGLSVPSNAESVSELYHRRSRTPYAVYRLSDCCSKRMRNKPQEVDLLLAIYTVNKAAKRARDMADKHYTGNRHGLSGYNKELKQKLYQLKDRGISEAYKKRRLTFRGFHGRLAVYEGEGYSFHSRLVPAEINPPTAEELQSEPVYIDAYPKGTKESKLKDAEFTLAKLPSEPDGFSYLPLPAKETRRRSFGYSGHDENEIDEEDYEYDSV
jgi:hypothetical protein